VTLIYLSLPSVEFALARVAARVAQGGHSVPEDVVRRRLATGRQNLERVYKPLVNRWLVYDNSEDVPLLLAEGTNP
jgi:predicted ABC-type ATPase